MLDVTLTADTRSVMLYVTLTADTRALIVYVILTAETRSVKLYVTLTVTLSRCTYFHMWYRSFSVETAQYMRNNAEVGTGTAANILNYFKDV